MSHGVAHLCVAASFVAMAVFYCPALRYASPRSRLARHSRCTTCPVVCATSETRAGRSPN
eukprot:1460749-Lingulodinium_polyedra.AAC.1